MVERGDRVSWMMLRKLCCCTTNTPSNRVSEKDVAAPARSQQTVVVIVTQNVVQRALVGKLTICLEKMKLSPVQMRLFKPTSALIEKSSLLRGEKRKDAEGAWVAWVWRGRDAQKLVDDGVRHFRQHFALQKRDVFYTDSQSSAQAEEKIWFPTEQPAVTSPEMTSPVPPALVLPTPSPSPAPPPLAENGVDEPKHGT